MEKNEFDFTGIFPNCTDNFLWGIYEHRSSNSQQDFTKLCSRFKNNVTNSDYSTHNFVQYCQVLGLYLEHIFNKKSSLEPKSCCKLFYYKLKKDIMDNFTLNCTEANNCYMKMIEQTGVNISNEILGVCKDYFVHVDTDALKIMENLFEIYKDINLFNTNSSQRTTTKMHPFKSSIEKLEKHPDKYKSQLKTEFEKIIEICKGYKKNWTYAPISHAASLLSDKWIDETRKKINGEDTGETRSNERHRETLQTNVLEAEALMGTMTEGETHTGISIGTIFITFSILIIMFILYKYTPYFSFLKPRERKLRRLHKNKKNNMDFIHTFGVEYKNSVDNRYKISYS
ncbi:variable surface protein [Plasmodium gonderi]|uniref:Variable surface protein n=1 Tax=Plasmodium gonderi TaxID=77519 RepID=A0A1Y1JTR3_PLAGO|nr:variable surface protein [Plasmodium gonderi]GAW84507.1 variable surface protein [Plasmodium gonderi]